MAGDDVQCLSDGEIDKFLGELDRNANGCIAYSEIEQKLDEVHEELAPNPQPHNLNYKDRDDEERHVFLRSLMGSYEKEQEIPTKDFKEIVKSWKIPSLEKDRKDEKDEKDYVKKMPIGRRFRAYWAVDGPEYVFVGMVVAMQIAFGTWQLVKYVSDMQYRHAFGWGVVLAKTSAGVLYPTLFFLVLSMSRYL
jgi:dual oxidase